jgi:hypothetical protein
MTERFYSCELLTEVVLNSRLATEGNMTSLSHIPGGNFLGIVAADYAGLGDKAYDVFHAGQVQFGDALPSHNGIRSYRMPITAMQGKGEESGDIYLHHLIWGTDGRVLPHLKGVQLKQVRAPYLNARGEVESPVAKTFRLKSAYDAELRRSKDAQMFGFESIRRGRSFLFSIRYRDQALIPLVEERLLGERRLGKSRSAEYGRVRIEDSAATQDQVPAFVPEGYCLVYVESPMCLFDRRFGMPVFEPDPSNFGLRNARIDWKRSLVRSHSYSVWNAKRNTTDTQRHAIAAGSVFCFVPDGGEMAIGDASGSAGGYVSEGLGRYLVNPRFLKGDLDTGRALHIKMPDGMPPQAAPVSPPLSDHRTGLAGFLKRRLEENERRRELTAAVMEALNSPDVGRLVDSRVSSSQWGTIREMAEVAADYASFKRELLGRDNKDAFLNHGVTSVEVWNKNNESLKKALERVLESYKTHGPSFAALLCSEIAKKKQSRR